MVCQLNKLQGPYEMLKNSYNGNMEQRLQSCSLRAKSVQKKLEEVLGRVTEERDELEYKFDECMEELGRVQGVEQVSLYLLCMFGNIPFTYVLTLSVISNTYRKTKRQLSS